MSENDMLEFSKARIAECEHERRAYGIWLARLSMTNWITIVLPAGLSLIAGATILGDLLEPHSKLIAGIAALVSGLLTAIHKGRNCDAHQAECRRLAQAYFGLKTRYESIEATNPGEVRALLKEIDERLAQLREGAQATVPDGCREKAQQREQP